MQASKRKHIEMAEKLERYEELFSMIETRGKRDATEIVRWIRSGQGAETIVKFMKTDNDLAEPDSQNLALQTFLVNLAHSTGTLRQIVRLAGSISKVTNSVQIPDPRIFDALCNRVARFSYIEDMLRKSLQLSSVPPLLLDGAAEPQRDDALYRLTLENGALEDDISMPDSPPHRVPATPWTTLTTDDDAVSHLVSLFLAWINPTWRFVEADLLLLGNLILAGFH